MTSTTTPKPPNEPARVLALGRLVRSHDKLPMLGWGFLTAWGLVGMCLGLPQGVAELPLMSILATTVSVACLLAFLLVARVFPGAIARMPTSDSSRRVACALMLAGCLMNMLGRAYDAGAATQYASHTIASVGYVMLALHWFDVYRREDPEEVERYTVLSTALCAVTFLVALVGPEILSAMIWVILPALSFWCLRLCPVSGSPEGANRRGAGSRQVARAPGRGRRGVPVVPARALAGIACAFGVFVASTVLTLAVGLAGQSVQVDPSLAIDARYAQLSGVIASAVLVLWCTVYAHRISLASFFKVLYPLCAIGMLLCGEGEGGWRFAGLCLLYAAQWVLYVFVWLYAAEAPRFSETGLETYALQRLAFDAGFVVSGLVVPWLSVIGAPLHTILFSTAAIFTLCILLPLDREVAGDDVEPITSLGTATPEGESREPGTDAAAAIAGEGDLAERVSSQPSSHLQPTAREQRLASRYALSERETQILSLLLRGYSLPGIRNELFISKGTVDTYVQRIYRKCDVHARQELVDLADAGLAAADSADGEQG